ncbi:MAG: hypothetical protein GXP32_02080 [Kiritimatiellaeota bacterium]|nr:hypothetical protein [Kiritimatiellota bacterium]
MSLNAMRTRLSRDKTDFPHFRYRGLRELGRRVVMSSASVFDASATFNDLFHAEGLAAVGETALRMPVQSKPGRPH